MTFAATLPLAFVMIAGPQIISAFFFATSEKWKGDSAAYLLGAFVGMITVVTISFLLAGGVSDSASGGDSKSRAVDLAIVALLLFAMVYVFRRRKRTDPPKWMGKLRSATPRLTFILGFLLLGVFPSDLVTSISVGAHLANHGDPWWHALPFVLLALFLLALPALLVLILGERARAFLPKVRNWMDENSWILSEVVLAFFVAIVLFSG